MSAVSHYCPETTTGMDPMEEDERLVRGMGLAA